LSYLIDTNAISEVRKGDRCDPNVATWYAQITDQDLFLGTLAPGEIRQGIELSRIKIPYRPPRANDGLA
jgi:predicted nucleic acid-binding protein